MQSLSKPRLVLGHILLIALSLSPGVAASSEATTNQQQIATIQTQMDAAIARVQQIVNQPVTELRRTPGMEVEKFGPGGWFHPGATKPMFATVDVRKTQELPYSRFQYVTSDLNPGVVFLGSELEFNSMTKYFYTNRSAPKKKLTEAEMLEINQLYREIGRCEHQLLDLTNPIPKQIVGESQQSGQSPGPQPLRGAVHQWILAHKPMGIGILAALLLALVILRAFRARHAAD